MRNPRKSQACWPSQPTRLQHSERPCLKSHGGEHQETVPQADLRLHMHVDTGVHTHTHTCPYAHSGVLTPYCLYVNQSCS